MNRFYLNGPRPNWLTRIVAAVSGTLLLIGLFVVGIIAWVLLAGVLMVGGVALSIWVWRERRRLEKSRRKAADSFIEVEYEVVVDDERRP